MNEYTVFVDSSCDMPTETLAEWGVKLIDLTFRFTDTNEEYHNGDMPISEFYSHLRAGRDSKTSAVNVENFKTAFEAELMDGRDVIYFAFSSGISTTYNSARLAVGELAPMYPERTVLAVDTLCASAGCGLLIYLALEQLKAGKSLTEVAEFATELRLSIGHWFTVDDLNFLKRGGRISAATALVGTALGIKPVLHVDDEGHLISMDKVRGRKKAIAALADKIGELGPDAAGYPVYISHGDCLADAEALAAIIKEKYGITVEIITYVGPVIGSHSGPGTLALFFIANQR